MNTDILHVSDTHLGKNQYGSDIRADDYAEAFDATITLAIDEDVDAVIHTGDLFDNRQPNTNAISQAFTTIKRLDSAGIPFLAIVGNHERKWDKQWMDIFDTLDNVHRLSPDKPYTVNDNVSIYGFDSFRDLEWEDSNFMLTPPENENNAVLLCMHELFKELIPPIKAKRSIEPVLENINIKPDAIALGDYHSSVDEVIMDVPVFYAGATERTSSTTADPTIRMIRFEDKKLVNYPWRKVEGIKENVPRPFYPIDIELKDDSTRTYIRDKVKSDIPSQDLDNSVVVLNLSGSSESPVSSNDAYSVLEQLNVPVPYINDKRVSETLKFDSVDTSDPTKINIEEMIENEISDDISDTVNKIDSEIVRDLSIVKSNIRNIVDEEFTGLEGDEQ